MRSRTLVATACATALLGVSAAIAQQNALVQTGSIPNLTSLREVDDDDRIIQPWNISVDRAEDMDLYSPAGQKIAEVEDVLENPSGRIAALAVESMCSVRMTGRWLSPSIR